MQTVEAPTTEVAMERFGNDCPRGKEKEYWGLSDETDLDRDDLVVSDSQSNDVSESDSVSETHSESETPSDSDVEDSTEGTGKARLRLQWIDVGRQFVAITEAQKYVREHDHVWHSGGTLRSGNTWKKFQCARHFKCPHLLRIWSTGTGFAVQQSGEHSEFQAPKKRGILGAHKAEVDELLLANVGPKVAAQRLQARHPELASLRILTTQIQNRKKVLKRKAVPIPMKTVADIKNFCNEYCLSTDATAEDQEIWGEMFVLPDSTFAEGNSHGFGFSTRALLANAVHTIKNCSARCLEADGTYKIEDNDWVLCILGTHSIKGQRGSVVHSFRPISYMLTKTETAYAYTKLMHSTCVAVKQLFNVQFDCDIGICDHSDAIRNAFIEVFPDITCVTCYPHVARKVREKRGKLRAKGARAEELIDKYSGLVNMLQTCRSQDQFAALSKLVIAEIKNKDGEPEYASWLQQEYLIGPWNTWFYAATTWPGNVPNNNPLESYNRRLKYLYGLTTRSSMAWLCGPEGMPRILKQESTEFADGVTDRLQNTPSWMLEKACKLLSSKNSYRRGETKRAVVYFVNTTSHLSEPVTKQRMRMYLEGLKGRTKCRKASSFEDQHLSLHMVAVDHNDPDLQQGCDCKMFYRARLCSHVLLVYHLLGRHDIHTQLTAIPRNKRRGRKRKSAPALVREEKKAKKQKKHAKRR